MNPDKNDNPDQNKKPDNPQRENDSPSLFKGVLGTAADMAAGAIGNITDMLMGDNYNFFGDNNSEKSNPKPNSEVNNSGGPLRNSDSPFVLNERSGAPVTPPKPSAPEVNSPVTPSAPTVPEDNTPVTPSKPTVPEDNSPADAGAPTVPEDNTPVVAGDTTNPEDNSPVAAGDTTNPKEGETPPPPTPPKFPEIQETKPAIYDNRWHIPVDDSITYNTFPMLSYEEIRNLIKKTHKEIEDWLQQLIDNNEALPMPFRPSSPERKNDKFIRVAPEDVEGKEVWFLGDIHGDLLSLTAAIKSIYSDNTSPNNKVIVLLGDVFDRLDDYFEAFYLILYLIFKYNKKIVWLSGNHDFVTYNETTDSFTSPTRPSEFTEWLNDPNGSDDEFRQIARQMTKLYSKLIDSLPAALYFPDGLFVAHGGFPHPHWYDTIKKWEDFGNSNYVYDFYWKRVHETKRHAMFNNSKGGELGYEDFDAFCDLLKDRFKSPVSAFLRGHDHIPERVKVFDKYSKPVMTFNTICCTDDGCDPLGKAGYMTKPVVVKYNPSIPDNYVSNEELEATLELQQALEDEQAKKEQLDLASEQVRKAKKKVLAIQQARKGNASDVDDNNTPSEPSPVEDNNSSPLDSNTGKDANNNQKSASSGNNNNEQQTQIPDLVIYRMDITRDLLDEWRK